MWTPVLFTRNSGEMVSISKDARAGGFDWYMPSEFHQGNHPLPGCSNLFNDVRHASGDLLPPWIMHAKDNKVFIGEYFHLDKRLNVHGNVHPHALCEKSAISYGYGFVAAAGTAIPSRAEMTAMSENWREELGRLVTKLNDNVAESAVNPDYLRTVAKSLDDLAPGGRAASGLNYGDNLWDRRAQEVMAGTPLDPPLLVNAKEVIVDPPRDWNSYSRFVEIGSKKKIPQLGSSSPIVDTTIRSKPWRERLTASERTFAASPEGFPVWGKPIAMTCLASLVAGCAVGAWLIHRRNSQSRNKAMDQSAAMGR